MLKPAIAIGEGEPGAGASSMTTRGVWVKVGVCLRQPGRELRAQGRSSGQRHTIRTHSKIDGNSNCSCP